VDPLSGSTEPGKWLRQHRQAAGLTQAELAELSGVSVRTIVNLERGRTRQPYPNSVRAITRALDLPDAFCANLIKQFRLAQDGDRRELTHGHHQQVAEISQPVPRQLPVVVGPFIGRQCELVVLDMSGVSRTTSTLHRVYPIVSRLPDGRLYADLRSHSGSSEPAGVSDLVPEFLRALQPGHSHTPPGLNEQVAPYRTMLAGKWMYVVLDNAVDFDHVTTGPETMLNYSVVLIILTCRPGLARSSSLRASR
jgi:transcriptional regulator with XRE-family HTH domain